LNDKKAAISRARESANPADRRRAEIAVRRIKQRRAMDEGERRRETESEANRCLPAI
jgi:hypothetical protein